MLRRPAPWFVAAAVVAVLSATACSGEVSPVGAAPGLVVVTTVSPITSIASSVIGDLAEVRGVVPEGTNSHTFEPRPSDAETLESADVVFFNGLQLEEPTLALARDVATNAQIVLIGDTVLAPDGYIFDFSFPERDGKPNPHLWTDPTLAAAYATVIADTMVAVDPDHAAEYRANAAAFTTAVDDFDRALRVSLATVPVADRKLLTYHDSFAYFAESYGWTVIGAIQPSDFDEPTAREVARLITQVRSEGVPAVFGSEVFPSPVLDQIAAESGARYFDDLRDDDLPGKPGDAEHSYLGLLRVDFATIVTALGGDATAILSFEMSDLVPDFAFYPQ